MSKINGEYGPQIQALQNQLAASQIQAEAAQNSVKCELYGGPNCKPGSGLAYTAIRSYESAMAKVTSLQGQISDLRGQQTTAQKNAANTETQQGLFANLSALNQIADGNTTIVFVWWLLFALFTLLGCAPAIVKTLIILGPQNVDELANAPEVFVVKVPVKRETLIAWQRGTALPHRPQA